MAVNVGGDVLTTYKTFDVELPEVEAYLSAMPNQYTERSVVGIEVGAAAQSQENSK